MKHAVLVDANGHTRVLDGEFVIVRSDPPIHGPCRIVDFYKDGKHDESRGTGYIVDSLREALNLIAEKERVAPWRPAQRPSQVYTCECGFTHANPRVYDAHVCKTKEQG